MQANLKQLAHVAGVDTRTIRGWVTSGCPCRQEGTSGRPWAFDLAEVWRWFHAPESDVPLDEARRRKLVAEAELAELSLQREQGHIVSRQEAIAVMCNATAAMRTKLLAIPTKCAAQVHSAASVAVCFDILKKAVNEALNELATMTLENDSNA